MEHPAEAFWSPASPSIWRLDITKVLRLSKAVCLHRFDQSVHGQVSQKPTNLLALRAPTLANYLYSYQLHDTAPLPVIAALTGKDAKGQWKTAQAKEYPPSLCKALALTIHDIVSTPTADRTPAEPDPSAPWPAGFEQLTAPYDAYDPLTCNQQLGQDYAHLNRTSAKPMPQPHHIDMVATPPMHPQTDAILYASSILAATTTSISDHQVLTLLQKWAFRRNHGRPNVQPQDFPFVLSNTLGFASSTKGEIPPQFTSDTRGAEPVLKTLATWARQKMLTHFGHSSLPFTSISLNSGFASRIHRDRGNVGPSMAIALGTYEGGNLQIWKSDTRRLPLHKVAQSPSVRIDTNGFPCIFDGTQAHAVTPFTGTRYSIVFFTCTGYQSIPPEVAAQAHHTAGIPAINPTTLQALAALQDRPPCAMDPVIRHRIQANKKEALRRKTLRAVHQPLSSSPAGPSATPDQTAAHASTFKQVPKPINPASDSETDNELPRGRTGMEAN